jgi:hypothetical protein
MELDLEESLQEHSGYPDYPTGNNHNYLHKKNNSERNDLK